MQISRLYSSMLMSLECCFFLLRANCFAYIQHLIYQVGIRMNNVYTKAIGIVSSEKQFGKQQIQPLLSTWSTLLVCWARLIKFSIDFYITLVNPSYDQLKYEGCGDGKQLVGSNLQNGPTIHCSTMPLAATISVNFMLHSHQHSYLGCVFYNTCDTKDRKGQKAFVRPLSFEYTKRKRNTKETFSQSWWSRPPTTKYDYGWRKPW